MPRVKKSKVFAALDKAARNLQGTDGGDGRVTRDAVARKLETLQGTERLLTEVLYDAAAYHHRFEPPFVTAAAVSAALAEAKDRIERCDINENGLSHDEVLGAPLECQVALALASELGGAKQTRLSLDAFRAHKAAALNEALNFLLDVLYELSDGAAFNNDDTIASTARRAYAHLKSAAPEPAEPPEAYQAAAAFKMSRGAPWLTLLGGDLYLLFDSEGRLENMVYKTDWDAVTDRAHLVRHTASKGGVVSAPSTTTPAGVTVSKLFPEDSRYDICIADAPVPAGTDLDSVESDAHALNCTTRSGHYCELWWKGGDSGVPLLAYLVDAGGPHYLPELSEPSSDGSKPFASLNEATSRFVALAERFYDPPYVALGQ